MTDCHPFGLLRATEAAMVLLRRVRLSAVFAGLPVSRTAVALLSTLLCVRQTRAGFHFFPDAPSRFP